MSTALARLFTCMDQRLLYDGASGALVRLDEGAYGSWQAYLAGDARVQPAGFADLMAAGLFRPPVYPDMSPAAQGLHSLCLNVAHTCDLACDYCFAGRGTYGGQSPNVMSPDVARAAVEYLVENSPSGRSLSVDFFGGEPLLAWPAVIAAVEHGKKAAAAAGKPIRFTLTTNAKAMDKTKASFCAAEMSTMIVSLDGRPQVHDRHRKDPSGGPSFDACLAGARMLADAVARRDGAATRQVGSDQRHSIQHHPDLPLGSGALWVRGTYTADNVDFAADVAHLASLGFAQVSMEPVALPPDARQALTAADLPAIRRSYEEIASMVLTGKVRFFHFELNLAAPTCAPKRFTGCSAGAGYACVDPAGGLFACHQFDGCGGFAMGSLPSPASDRSVPTYVPHPDLLRAHVGNKPACRSCWAQLQCGGGCHYAAWKANGSLLEPYAFGCELLKTRLEVALALQALRQGA